MVLISHGPVWSQSFSSPVTGLPNTSGNNTSGQTHTLDTQQKNKKSTQDVGLKCTARKCWNCEKEKCGGRIRKDQCTDACGLCGCKERIADTPFILVNFF